MSVLLDVSLLRKVAIDCAPLNRNYVPSHHCRLGDVKTLDDIKPAEESQEMVRVGSVLFFFVTKNKKACCPSYVFSACI